MKKIQLYFLFCFLPTLSFSQWTPLGNAVNGIAGNDKLGFTHAIDMDSAGTTLAVGTPYNSDVFSYSGYAKVLDWNGTAWVQRGNTFLGTDSTLEGTGAAVDLSANGKTVAVSSPWGYNSLGYKCGIVRVFDWNGSAWVQRGSRIDGEGNIIPIYSGDVFGTAMQLSSDGNYLIVGARSNTPGVGVNQLSGHARIYHWDGTAWIQKGQDLDAPIGLGTAEFGYAVSISDAGNRIAVGGRSFTRNFQGQGIAIMYEWGGTEWKPMGDTLFGAELGASLGAAIQLTRDGNSVALGSPKSNTFLGSTQILDWNGTSWLQRGTSILGVNGGQSGTSLDFSFNGNVIAIGEPWTSSAKGAVRLFEWKGGSWQQIGNTISPSGNNIEAFGSSVRLNAAGTRVAIGVPNNDDIANNAGKVRVYDNPSFVGIGEQTKTSLNYFPNPTTGLVKISSEETIERISVFSITGQEISTENVFSMEANLDLSQQSMGAYYAKIETKRGIQIIQITKF
ncbi:MAG: T9SS type A sorting domain-containing protein [Bacteroidia bacterium]|nr:T9SS type A sorting domain-containing protein [Bacteroidia bacterium]MCF8427679.1 T9SS type A sorting domain-containing protein [Bacteroidia bacterium]MCF8447946.1 T9SS type A sorting domain-containing protein [Bacteroidia bacterium]